MWYLLCVVCWRCSQEWQGCDPEKKFDQGYKEYEEKKIGVVLG